jgi:hypothetical protein
MQLIIPPIEEDASPHGDMAKNETLTGTEENTTTTTNHGEGVLSQDLRESFETMKAVWRQAARDSGEDSAATEELKRKGREQAVETALAVDSEVTQWQKGIAELEAMLSAAEGEDGSEGGYIEEGEEDSMEENNHEVVYPRGLPFPAVRFPSLPPMVVPDDDDQEDTTPSRSGAN